MPHSSRIVLYDDQCPLCLFQMRVITWLDWFNTVSLLAISHPEATKLAPTLSREDLLEAIHCVTSEGYVHRGARCIRYIAMRMPLAVPLALVLWIPGVIFVAEVVYRWGSRNRHLLGRLFGCKEACAIMPMRKRDNEQQFSSK